MIFPDRFAKYRWVGYRIQLFLKGISGSKMVFKQKDPPFVKGRAFGLRSYFGAGFCFASAGLVIRLFFRHWFCDHLFWVYSYPIQ